MNWFVFHWGIITGKYEQEQLSQQDKRIVKTNNQTRKTQSTGSAATPEIKSGGGEGEKCCGLKCRLVMVNAKNPGNRTSEDAEDDFSCS